MNDSFANVAAASPEERPPAEPSPPAAAAPASDDRISELYYGNIFAPETAAIARARVHWMCSQCRGETVLDVGCSQGIATILLAREGFHVTGLDVRAEAIAFARAASAHEPADVQGRITWVEGGLAEFVSAEPFDTLLLGEILEHQAAPARFLAQAVKHVRPGGRIVITTPFGLHPDPDHKSTLFPSHVLDMGAALGLRVRRLDVVDGYIRIRFVNKPGSDERSGRDLTELLGKTERGALQTQQKLYGWVDQKNDQIKKRAETERALRQRLKITETNRDRLVAEHKQAVEGAGKAHAQELDKLNQSLRAARAARERLEAEHAQAMADLEQTHARQVAGLHQRLEADGAERLRLEAEHDQAMAGLEQSHVQEAAKLRQQLDTSEAERRRLAAQHEEAVAGLGQTHAREAADLHQRLEAGEAEHQRLKAEHAHAIARLEQTHARQQAELRQRLEADEADHQRLVDEHVAAVAALQQVHARQTTDVRDRLDAAEAERRRLATRHEEAVAGLGQAHARQTSDLRQQLEAVEAERQRLIAEHAQAVAGLRRAHAQQTAELQERLDAAAAERSRLATRHEEALAGLQRAHAQQTAELQERLDAAAAERSRLAARHEEAVASFQQAHAQREETVASLQQAHAQQTAELQERLDAGAAERDRLAARHEEAVASLQQAHAQREETVASLQQAHAQQTAELQERLDAGAAERDRLAARHEEAVASFQQAHAQREETVAGLQQAYAQQTAALQERLDAGAAEREQLVAENATAVTTLQNAHGQEIEARRAAAQRQEESERRRLAVIDGQAAAARQTVPFRLGWLLATGFATPAAAAHLPGRLRHLLADAKFGRELRRPGAAGTRKGRPFARLLAEYEAGGAAVVAAALERRGASAETCADAYTALARHFQAAGSSEAAAELARRAYDTNPQPARAKWLAFRLFNAGALLEPAMLLGGLPPSHLLSASERRRAEEIAALARLLEEPPALVRAERPSFTPRRGSILYVAASALPYHASTYTARTHQLLQSLRPAGIRVTAVTRPGYPWSRADRRGEPERDVTTVDDIEYRHLREPSGQMPLDRRFAEAAKAIGDLATAKKVAAIHAASNYENALPALLAARALGLPFVYDMRGLPPPGHAAGLPADDPRRERHRLALALEAFVVRNADRVYAVSHALARQLREWGVTDRAIAPLADYVAAEAPEEPALPNPARESALGGELARLTELYRGRGPRGVIDALSEPAAGLAPKTRAIRLLQLGRALAEAGDDGAEVPLAELALTTDRSETVLRNILWVLQRNRQFEAAIKIGQELERLIGPNPQGRQVEFLTRLRGSQTYLLSVLDLVGPRRERAFEPVAGRLCYCLHNSLPYSSGGYAARSHGLAVGLAETGFDLVALTRPGFPIDVKPGLAAEAVAVTETIDGVRYARIAEPARAGRSAREYITLSADAFEDQLKEVRPEIVVAASNHVTGLPALIAARRCGLPFVYEVRGLWEITRASREQLFRQTPAFAMQRILETAVARHADHVFALTQGLKDELIARGVPSGNVSLLPNSCDPARFVPMPRDEKLALRLDIPTGVPVIGYVGTFVDYEGLDDLVEACAAVAGRGLDFRLLLVGNENASGQDRGPITEQIAAIAAERGFADRLIMPGRVPHEEVERYYSLIDICPFPRKPLPVCEMVSPLKPVEALAMEKAVVVSSVRALTEMIDDGKTGVVFEKGNIEALAAALARLLAHPGERRRLGRAGRAWVLRERTWTKTARQAEQQLATLTGWELARKAPQPNDAHALCEGPANGIAPPRVIPLSKVVLRPEILETKDSYAARTNRVAGRGVYSDWDWARISSVFDRLKDGGRALDVGVGSGQLINTIAASGRFASTVGIDVATHSKFIRLTDAFDLRQMSVTEMSFADGSFDVVTCLEVLEHLDKESFINALGELRRVCRGQLLMTVPFEEPEPIPKFHKQRFDRETLREYWPDARIFLLERPRVSWALMEEIHA